MSLAKVWAYRGQLHGWRYIILIDAFLVSKRGISPIMKSPHTLHQPAAAACDWTRDLPLHRIPSSAKASDTQAT